MADISLTASMRSNLLSLQQTQSLMDTTQERLSTGKKVNSAIDNPSSYYTAQSLSNRASDLSTLLDSMGQGIQTIKAADEAIKTITSFAQQAKALANSARDVSGNFDKYAITSKEITAGATAEIYIDARTDTSKFDMQVSAGDGGKKFTVFVGDTSHEITITNTGSTEGNVDDISGKFAALGLKVDVTDRTAGKFTVSSTDGKAVSWVNGTKTGGANPYDDGIGVSASAAKVVSLKAASTGANSASIAAAINTAVGAGSGIVAETDGRYVSVTAKNKELNIFSATSDKAAVEKLGLLGTRGAGDAYAISVERTSYANQFDEILRQVDSLAKDAGYKGVNLLQENDLKVVFNEDRTSSIEIKGVDGSSKGLGISGAKNDWQKNSNIDNALLGIEGAISKLRTYASDFGNNYSIVQTREEFTDNLVNVLTEGADKLTLADMNEESANMLALQTRQQLAINSLSLASQAAQSVLKLF